MEVRRLLMEMASPAGGVRYETLDPLLLVVRKARRDRTSKALLDRGMVRSRALSCTIRSRRQSGRHAAVFRKLGGGPSKCLVGAGISGAIEENRTRKKRGNVQRLEGQGPLDRG